MPSHRPPKSIQPSEITPEGTYLNRRRLMETALAAGVACALPRLQAAPSGAPLQFTRNDALSLKETPNSFEHISTYNNYYEFGTDKSDPARNADALRTRP